MYIVLQQFLKQGMPIVNNSLLIHRNEKLKTYYQARQVTFEYFDIRTRRDDTNITSY